MAQGQGRDDDPVFTHPEEYGIENLDAPGEPDRATQPPSEPVVGTGRDTREMHKREHDERGNFDVDVRAASREREEGRRAVESGLDEAEEDGAR